MIDVMIHPSGLLQLNNDEKFIAFIDESEYDELVNALEEKAQLLWPGKFRPRTLESWHEEFTLVHRDDGSTDMIPKINDDDKTLIDFGNYILSISRIGNEGDPVTNGDIKDFKERIGYNSEIENIIKQDKLNRERQIPINSRTR